MIGYVYKICDNTNNNVYYGSTTQTLKQRLCEHKNLTCCSKSIIENNNYIIILVETIEFQDKKQLLERERYYIQNYPCINERLPITTYEEKKEYQKEWRENNKEYHKEYDKERYDLNKEQINERIAEHYQLNKEKIKEYKKKYYEENKDKIKEKITCDCGAVIIKCNLIKHKKTQKHLNYVNSINEVN